MNNGARTIGWGIMMMAMLMGCSSTLGQSGSASAPPAWWVYVGGNGKEGIHLYKFDMTTAALADQGIAGPAVAPGFMAIAPNKKFMYSVATIDGPNHQPIGGVAAFSIDATTGKLTPINEQSSQGEDPCFVAVDPQGKNALVANYNSATVAVLPIDASGKLAPATCTVKQTGSSTDRTRQTHAYAHSINLDPAGKFAQALNKLVKELESGKSKLLGTSAIKEFRELHTKGHFPGLGYVKKLSMKHHIETLADYLG